MGKYYKEKNEYCYGDTSVIVITIDREYIESNIDAMTAKLHAARRKKVCKFNNIKAKTVSIAAGMLLQEIIEKKYGIMPKDIEVCQNENGKPYISNVSDFRYNLSHSADCVAIAYGTEDIGIDVEKIGKESLRVAKRCFTDEEYNYVVCNEDKVIVSSERFARVWTMKESYLKCIGKGISIPLDSFETDVNNMCVKNTAYKYYEMIKDDYMIMLCKYKI